MTTEAGEPRRMAQPGVAALTNRPLWHYTCDCGRDAIGDRGELVPILDRMPRLHELSHLPEAPLYKLVWLTDLETPDRMALGLTMYTIGCDRIRHRYRATDTTGVRPYVKMRRALPADLRSLLEQGDVRPMHWFVAYAPIPVIYDPR